jgi:hypothetical protein
MQSTKAADAGTGVRGSVSEIDQRYGKIGISAVAAAVRYQGAARPPAPVAMLTDRPD